MSFTSGETSSALEGDLALADAYRLACCLAGETPAWGTDPEPLPGRAEMPASTMPKTSRP